MLVRSSCKPWALFNSLRGRVNEAAGPLYNSKCGRGPAAIGLRVRCASDSSISSPTNPYVKHCVRLRESSKYRNENKRALLVGDTLLKELSGAANVAVRTVITLQPGAAVTGVQCQRLVLVTPAVMKKVCGLETMDDTITAAEVDLPPLADFLSAACQPRRLLALEGVQDPGNLGTLLRTALAFGWDGAFLLPGCCDPFNDKALRASRGAAFKLPLAVGTWQDLQQVAHRQEMLMLAAEPTASGAAPELADLAPLRQSLQDRQVCLVLGTEGQGLSSEALRSCRAIAVPMAGDMESLNVGIAGGILMFMLSSSMLSLVDQLGALYLDQQLRR